MPSYKSATISTLWNCFTIKYPTTICPAPFSLYSICNVTCNLSSDFLAGSVVFFYDLYGYWRRINSIFSKDRLYQIQLNIINDTEPPLWQNAQTIFSFLEHSFYIKWFLKSQRDFWMGTFLYDPGDVVLTSVLYYKLLVQGFLPFPIRHNVSYSGDGQFNNHPL